MYSTQKNICEDEPTSQPNSFCGSLVANGPTLGSGLKGGLRTRGKFKRSLPRVPLVTIVTVVRNCVATIGQCVRSVLSQTYENIEYVVVDGASTDGTVEVLKQYADALDYLISEPDSGIYDGMNKGLRLSTGDYILFLNADDWYRSGAVELLVKKALECKAEITHADAGLVDESGHPCGTLAGWLNDGIYTIGMPLRHETMLVARNVYESLGGYDDSYQIIADYVWTLKAYRFGIRFAHLQEPVLWFGVHGISNTEHSKRISERSRLYSELFPFLNEQDLHAISNQTKLSSQGKLALIAKYEEESELFARSMAFNIKHFDAPRPHGFLKRMLHPIRRSRFWPWIAPSVYRIKSMLRN